MNAIAQDPACFSGYCITAEVITSWKWVKPETKLVISHTNTAVEAQAVTVALAKSIYGVLDIQVHPCNLLNPITDPGVIYEIENEDRADFSGIHQ